MVAKQLQLFCPQCDKQIKKFTEIAFTEDFKVIVKGRCCGQRLSATLDLLPLIPGREEKPS